MRKRLTLVLLSLLLLNLNLAGCQSPGSTSAPLDPDSESVTELDVCSTAYTTGVGLDYAEQMGLFSKVGLEVNLVPILNSSNAVAALVAGDVDLCLIGGSAVVNAALAGEDLVFVAGVINQQFYSLVVQPEVKEAEDLKGKVVGVSNPGTLSDTVMRGILESLGLRADEEVLLQAVGKTNERLTAMEAGHIVGTIIMATEVPIAKEMGFKVLVDAADLDTPYQHTGIATKRAFTQSNGQAVARFVQATIESLALMKQDRPNTIHILAENLLLDPEEDAAYLNEIYDILVLNHFPRRPYPTRQGIQARLDFPLDLLSLFSFPYVNVVNPAYLFLEGFCHGFTDLLRSFAYLFSTASNFQGCSRWCLSSILSYLTSHFICLSGTTYQFVKYSHTGLGSFLSGFL